MSKSPVYSVEVGKATAPTESAPRRNVVSAKTMWTYPLGRPNMTTVYEIFKDGCKTWATKDFAGSRKFIRDVVIPRDVVKKVNGQVVTTQKNWTYFERGEYTFITFAELEKQVGYLASGLVQLGLTPGESRFNIYCTSSLEWMMTALALATQSVTLVTAYDNLGMKGLDKSLKQTQCSAILSEAKNLAVLANIVHGLPSLKFVVYRDFKPLSDSELQAIKELKEADINVIAFSRVIELGKRSPVQPLPPKPSDVYAIMYTSGSGGSPKGVVLTHSNVVAGVAGCTGISNYVKSTDVFMCVLPLAHIYEFTAELSAFVWGCCLGYGNPKTLGEVNMHNCPGDMLALRPTLMVGVPALWELIRKGVLVKVEKQSPTAQRIFWGAYNIKNRWTSSYFSSLIDNLIFRRVRKATGGRLRAVINGGASLSKDTRVFISTVLAPIMTGYGTTETTAMASMLNLASFDLDSTGQPVPVATIKLVDSPEGGYYTRNGQGEVYINGPCVAQGYFEDPVETEANFTKDGWFKTGDIAEWTDNGCLKFIDRRKNLVKTLTGECVALEMLESVYRADKYVQNILVVADDQHHKPVGVVVPYGPALRNLCSELGIKYRSDVFYDQKVYKAILSSIQDTGKSQGLQSFEILPAVAFSEEEWTSENGFLTHTQKLQRRFIRDEFHDAIHKAFKDVA